MLTADVWAALAQRTVEHIGAKIVAHRIDESTLAENLEAATVFSDYHNPVLNSVAKFLSCQNW
jgi:hypothetical protein